MTLPQTSFGNGLGPNTLRMSGAVPPLARPGAGRRSTATPASPSTTRSLRAHEQRDFLAYGAALTAPLGALTLAEEIEGLAGEGAPGADERHEARAGLRFGRGALRGDAAVRRGLGDADGSWGATAGLTWTRSPD